MSTEERRPVRKRGQQVDDRSSEIGEMILEWPRGMTKPQCGSRAIDSRMQIVISGLSQSADCMPGDFAR
jgi:hypothetical protein